MLRHQETVLLLPTVRCKNHAVSSDNFHLTIVAADPKRFSGCRSIEQSYPRRAAPAAKREDLDLRLCNMSIFDKLACTKETILTSCTLAVQWRIAESAILPISCFVLPVVFGSIASYMHYSNPAWRERHGHAPASMISLSLCCI